MLNSNQFNLTAATGQLDLKAGGIDASFTVRVNSNSTETILAGTALKLVDMGVEDKGGIPIVDVVDDATDVAFGARIYSFKKGSVKAGDITEVSYKGCVQYFTASAPLTRGSEVSVDIATPGNVKALGTDARLGIIIDKASAAGDLVRVIIDPAKA